MDQLVAEVVSLISKPARIPRENPTKSYWQHVPHGLADHQSALLPTTTDYIIIGSGMTGVAAAKALLEGDDNCKVVVLEARSICSGATGRNGGHLKSSAVLDFGLDTQRFGIDEARKIADYQHLTCRRVKEVALEYCPEYSEIRDVNSIGVFEDAAMLSHAMASIDEYKSKVLGDHSDYATVDPQIGIGMTMR